MYVFMYVYMYVLVYMYLCMYASVHAYIDVCIYVRMYVLTYARNCLLLAHPSVYFSYFPFRTEGGNVFWRILTRDDG